MTEEKKLETEKLMTDLKKKMVDENIVKLEAFEVAQKVFSQNFDRIDYCVPHDANNAGNAMFNSFWESKKQVEK